METSVLWARGAAAAIALLACAGCAGTPDATLEPSPSTPVIFSPYPSPSQMGAPEVTPLDEPVDCRLALDVLPVEDPAAGVEALRWQLLGDGSADIASVMRTPDGAVVTPSTDADEPAAIVGVAIARIDAAGFAPPEWALAAAVHWSFDDLCAGITVVLGEMGSPGGVQSVGVDEDARLRVGIEAGASVPASIVDLETAHPGMLRIVEETGVDVAP